MPNNTQVTPTMQRETIDNRPIVSSKKLSALINRPHYYILADIRSKMIGLGLTNSPSLRGRHRSGEFFLQPDDAEKLLFWYKANGVMQKTPTQILEEIAAEKKQKAGMKSSKEIADELGKAHGKVLKDIRSKKASLGMSNYIEDRHGARVWEVFLQPVDANKLYAWYKTNGYSLKEPATTTQGPVESFIEPVLDIPEKKEPVILVNSETEIQVKRDLPKSSYDIEKKIGLTVIEQILNIQLIHNFQVGEFCIDGYDAKNKVAYEFFKEPLTPDDYKRLKYLRQLLHCSFVRIKV